MFGLVALKLILWSIILSNLGTKVNSTLDTQIETILEPTLLTMEQFSETSQYYNQTKSLEVRESNDYLK